MLRFELRAYINVKRAMIRTDGFVPACAAVFDDLLHQQKSSRKFTHIRQATIAARTGYSRQWVNHCLQWLRAHGFVNSLQMGWIPPGKKTRIKGCCKYWMAETPADHAYFRERFLDKWAARMTRRARRVGIGGQIVGAPRAGSPKLTGTAAGDKNPVESRCQVEATSQSTTELYPDIFDGAKKNLASPALQRLLKEESWRS